jgi:hypothetical protein
MRRIDRREFLSKLSGSIAISAIPFAPARNALALEQDACWLSVCAPLVIEDASLGLHTDIILTSASFDGIDGHGDPASSTDYEINLYEQSGRPVRLDGAKAPLRVNVPAMRTTLIGCGDLVGRDRPFCGGLRVRMRAKGRRPAYVSDLFSAAYVRWNYQGSFDTLHAHPDPVQLQQAVTFYSSMPFPSLEEFSCTLSVFNPYEAVSEGRIIVYSQDGGKRIEQPYRLAPFESSLLSLNLDAKPGAASGISKYIVCSRPEIKRGGSITIENSAGSVKNFAYLMIKGKAGNAFSAEHTIHQGSYAPRRAASPFGPGGAFKAGGWVYSSFIFNRSEMAGLSLSSRVYLSSGRPLEDELWMLGYVTDALGQIAWSTRLDEELKTRLQKGLLDQGAIRMLPFQSCGLDFERLAIDAGFAGGLGLAVSSPTSHVLNKIEVRVNNWGTSAFSHFRPGSRGARELQSIKTRGGLATDYIVTDARLRSSAGGVENDCLVALFNIEEDRTGNPVIEVFGGEGFIARRGLGRLPKVACRYFLLSQLFPQLVERGHGPFTLRLIDETAVVTLSALHIDYKKRDVAIDHGSDRFSTHIDFGCK